MTILHGHSDYSLLDGICKIKDYVAKAKSLGHKAVGLTDHGTLAGLVDFWFECKEQGIKPILGCEFYHEVDDPKINYHVILLAMNRIGFDNLIKLHNIAQDNFYKKPRITTSDILDHGQGLIGTGACLQGYLTRRWLDTGVFDEFYFEDMSKELEGGFYLEVHDNGIPEQIKWNEYVLEKWPKYCLAANDVHYLDKEHDFAHRVALAISTHKGINDPKAFKFNGTGYWFREDLDLPQFTKDSTDSIAGMVGEYEIGYDKWQLPQVEVKEDLYFQLQDEIAMMEMNNLIEDAQVYIDRLTYEFQVIEDNGFLPYFQIVAGIYSRMREEKRFVGWGRGSTGGSLVAYLMGITNIDPIRWGLIFERFLNPGRVTMPDIDMDFQPQDRQIAIDELSKYGNAVQIGAYGTLGTREVIKAVAKAMGVLTGLSAYIPAAEPVPTIAELMKTKAFSTQVKKEKNEEFIKVCIVLEGIKKTQSIHAAGVVLTDDEIPTKTTRSGSNKNTVSTEWDMYALEKLKYVKFDVLGVKNLELIDIVCKQVGVVPDSIPLEDEKTFKLIQKGHTVGVFQWESEGYRKLIMDVHPDRFSELIDLNTLYRPGCLESGITASYIKRKHGIEQTRQLHKNLHLNETYGLPLYQEDMLVIARDVAGFTLSEADVLRKAIGKKEKETFAKIKEDFINGARKYGDMVGSEAESLWNVLEKSSRYTWNKSHGVAYTLISWWTAYLSANYPDYFMAELLNQADGADRRRILLSEARRRGIRLEYPDINRSTERFEALQVEDGTAIYLGLAGIKFVGEKTVDKILKERNANGSFDSTEELKERTKISKRVIEYLGYAGAFGAPTDIEMEREALGYNLGARMIDRYWWSDFVSGIGEVIDVHKILTKRGDPMAFLNIEFRTEIMSVTVFPEMWSMIKDHVDKGTVAIFKYNDDKILQYVSSPDDFGSMRVHIVMADEFLSFYPSLIGKPNIYAGGMGIAKIELDEQILTFIRDEFGIERIE